MIFLSSLLLLLMGLLNSLELRSILGVVFQVDLKTVERLQLELKIEAGLLGNSQMLPKCVSLGKKDKISGKVPKGKVREALVAHQG